MTPWQKGLHSVHWVQSLCLQSTGHSSELQSCQTRCHAAMQGIHARKPLDPPHGSDLSENLSMFIHRFHDCSWLFMNFHDLHDLILCNLSGCHTLKGLVSHVIVHQLLPHPQTIPKCQGTNINKHEHPTKQVSWAGLWLKDVTSTGLTITNFLHDVSTCEMGTLKRHCHNRWIHVNLYANLPSGYDIHSLPWKITMLLRTVNHHKPSISMGHLYHGYVC